MVLPTLNSELIKVSDVPNINIPFINTNLPRTKKIISKIEQGLLGLGLDSLEIMEIEVGTADLAVHGI